MLVKLIGVSGYTPFPSKTAKLYTSCRIFYGKSSIQIDVGNPWSGPPVDALLISHMHFDHIDELKSVPAGQNVFIPSLSFHPVLTAKNPELNYRVFKGWTSVGKIKISSFPVLHSSTSLTYGFKFSIGGKTLVWVPDWCIIPDYIGHFKDADYLFLGAAAMKKAIRHKGYGHCQAPVEPILKSISEMKKPPKKIFLIHYGMALRPINVKVSYLQKKFPSLKIERTRDGQILDLF